MGCVDIVDGEVREAAVDLKVTWVETLDLAPLLRDRTFSLSSTNTDTADAKWQWQLLDGRSLPAPLSRLHDHCFVANITVDELRARLPLGTRTVKGKICHECASLGGRFCSHHGLPSVVAAMASARQERERERVSG